MASLAFFPKKHICFSGNPRVSRIYDISCRLVLAHTYFQQECLNRKFSSLPIPATKSAPGITTHAMSAGSIILIDSFHAQDARALQPQAEREAVGSLLTFPEY